MSRYIDKDKLIADLQTDKWIVKNSLKYVLQDINEQPEADVVEVKHGKCIKNTPNPDKMVEFHKLGIGKGMSVNSIFWTCSECGEWISPRNNYCPNCGARMDGDKE